MIGYTRYQLSQKASLNRLDLTSVREGMLIQVDDGYACVHPWAELGDPTLAECIADLKAGRSNPLLERAFYAAERFGEQIPDAPTIQCHATLPQLNGTPVLAAVDAEFKAVKIKRGKDWMRLRKKTQAFIEGYPCLRWRIDFNGAFTSHRELAQFLGMMPNHQIDFIEDPFSDPKLAETWKGFPIAYDRVIPEKLDLTHNYLIAKPAIQSLETIEALAGERPEKVIFTSYMDHPVGQIFALQEAQRFYQKHKVESPPLCGLATHELYESSPYSQLLGELTPTLQSPDYQKLLALLERENYEAV